MDNEKEIIQPVACLTCCGAGWVDGEYKNGEPPPCDDCYGRGFIPCNACAGSGKEIDENPHRSHYCFQCLGKGYPSESELFFEYYLKECKNNSLEPLDAKDNWKDHLKEINLIK